jgi:cytoskeletal protein CcmA (bactofilin family)
MTEARIIRSGEGGELIGPQEVVEIDGSHKGAIVVQGRLIVRPGCRHEGAIHVFKGGSLQLDGAQEGALGVDGHVIIGSQGHLTGAVTIAGGGTLRIDGSAEGAMNINEGGELNIGPSGIHTGAGTNDGKIINAGRLNSDIHGNAPIEGPIS